MSTNCIVKKYKAEVNNNNLPFYGRAKIYFDQIESASMYSNGLRRYASMYKDGKVELDGNIYFADSSMQSLGVKELGTDYTEPFYVTNGSGVMLVNDSVEYIQAIPGASNYVKSYHIRLEEFSEITSLKGVNIRNSIKSEGDIINFAQCIGLTEFVFGDTKIDGSLSEFAISQIDMYGRISGSLVLYANSHVIVYGKVSAVNNAEYTINFIDNSHFNIVASSYTVSFTKSGGVWSYERS